MEDKKEEEREKEKIDFIFLTTKMLKPIDQVKGTHFNFISTTAA